jgi:hypothetical protein
MGLQDSARVSSGGRRRSRWANDSAANDRSARVFSSCVESPAAGSRSGGVKKTARASEARSGTKTMRTLM